VPPPDPVRRALRGAVRFYVRHSPVRRGTGRLVRWVLDPLVPPEGPLTVTLPGGAVAHLRYDEALGRIVGWLGAFEPAELAYTAHCLRPGDVAFDVGANVGLFTLVMARAVGPQGRVFSFEPHPAARARLQAHLEENHCANVEVVEAAASDRAGTQTLHDAADAAFASVVGVLPGHEGGGVLDVPTTTLDARWTAAGCPRVRLVKVDVEGAEESVLRGAAELLDVSRPALLVEANTREALRSLRAMLHPLGYRDRRPWGFDHHNRLFEAAGA